MKESRSIFKKRIVGVIAIVIIAGLVAGIAIAIINVRSFLTSVQAHNNLKWIAVSLHHYHDDFDCFPPATTQYGSKKHSWRSLLEEYITQSPPVYDRAQEWDSESNVSDLSLRYDAFAYQYLALVGPNTVWNPEKPITIRDIKDGTSNTAMLIGVRNTGVRWHQPVDALASSDGALTLDGQPLDLSHDIYIVTADGGVHYFADGISPETMRNLLTIDGGDDPFYW